MRRAKGPRKPPGPIPLSQGLEERPYLFGEEIRLLERGKVTALVEDGEPLNVEVFLSPAPRSEPDLTREGRAARRDLGLLPNRRVRRFRNVMWRGGPSDPATAMCRRRAPAMRV